LLTTNNPSDATEDATPVRSKLSLEDQLKLKDSFDQPLQDITLDPNTSEMGLGRLEFGYPFKPVSGFPSSSRLDEALHGALGIMHRGVFFWQPI
jgi:hypothetical protein